MKNKLKNGIALSLIPQIFLVKWLGNHHQWIEDYFSNGIYPYISAFFRALFGWVPFSVGEILYSAIAILGIRYIYKNWIRIKQNKMMFLRDSFMVVAVFYFTFHAVWGFNYYRQPISSKLDIGDEATYEELKTLTQNLVTKTNTLQKKITNDTTVMVQIPYTKNEIFAKSVDSYHALENKMPYLEYQNTSIKKSMFSIMSSYMGIGGYFNPFTNEAQVNSKTPLFRFTVVSGHEIGHQVGYAAENETNFIGYLVTLKNDDIYFQYSAYAYALSYCLNALYRSDADVADNLYRQINEGVLKNYRELQDFHESYENPFEPIFKSILSAFLKANNQKDGIKSYGKVVNLMVGYHKKYGV